MATLPEGWEFDYDGSRWFYRYKPSGIVQYTFPKPGDEFPDFVNAFSPPSPLPPEEKLVSQQQVKRRNTAGTTGADNLASSPPSRAQPQSDLLSEPTTSTPATASASATVFGPGDAGLPWFQPDSFLYLGPGSYYDASPLQEVAEPGIGPVGGERGVCEKKGERTGESDMSGNNSGIGRRCEGGREQRHEPELEAAMTPVPTSSERTAPLASVAATPQAGESPLAAAAPATVVGELVMSQPVMSQPVMGEPVMGEVSMNEQAAGDGVSTAPAMVEPVMGEPVMGELAVGDPLVAEPVMAELAAVTQPTMDDLHPRPVVEADPVSMRAVAVVGEPVMGESVLGEPVIAASSATAEPPAGEPVESGGLASGGPLPAAHISGASELESTASAPPSTSSATAAGANCDPRRSTIQAVAGAATSPGARCPDSTLTAASMTTFSPIGLVAELESDHTALCVEGLSRPPAELPGDNVLATPQPAPRIGRRAEMEDTSVFRIVPMLSGYSYPEAHQRRTVDTPNGPNHYHGQLASQTQQQKLQTPPQRTPYQPPLQQPPRVEGEPDISAGIYRAFVPGQSVPSGGDSRASSTSIRMRTHDTDLRPLNDSHPSASSRIAQTDVPLSLQPARTSLNNTPSSLGAAGTTQTGSGATPAAHPRPLNKSMPSHQHQREPLPSVSRLARDAGLGHVPSILKPANGRQTPPYDSQTSQSYAPYRPPQALGGGNASPAAVRASQKHYQKISAIRSPPAPTDGASDAVASMQPYSYAGHLGTSALPAELQDAPRPLPPARDILEQALSSSLGQQAQQLQAGPFHPAYDGLRNTGFDPHSRDAPAPLNLSRKPSPKEVQSPINNPEADDSDARALPRKSGPNLPLNGSTGTRASVGMASPATLRNAMTHAMPNPSPGPPPLPADAVSFETVDADYVAVEAEVAMATAMATATVADTDSTSVVSTDYSALTEASYVNVGIAKHDKDWGVVGDYSGSGYDGAGWGDDF